MPRSSKKPKRAGKAEKKEKKKDTKKPKSAGEIKQAKPLDFEGLKDANDRCLGLINVVVILCGVGLGAVAITSSNSSATIGTAWTSGVAGVAGGLIASGFLGLWVSKRESGFGEVDMISNLYFALMVILLMVTLWLSLFMTFNIDEVKWITKAWIYSNWAEFWAALSPGEQTHLQETGGCSAEGHAMSELNDDCWEELKQSIFRSWKLGGLLAVIMAALLPFNIFFVGTKIGWEIAMDALQSVMSFVSIANGVAFLMLAFDVEGVAVVGCVLAGFGVITLGIVQLVPNLFKDKLGDDFEEQAGKPLFFIYSGLTVTSVVSGVYLIMNKSAADLAAAFSHTKLGTDMEQAMDENGLTDPAVDAEINHEFGTADMIGLVGWGLLLIGELLALQAICNLSDWMKAPPKTPSGNREKKTGDKRKRKAAGGKKSSRSAKKEEDYEELDEDEADDDGDAAASDKDDGSDDEDDDDDDDGRGGGRSDDDSDSDSDAEHGRGRRRRARA